MYFENKRKPLVWSGMGLFFTALVILTLTTWDAQASNTSIKARPQFKGYPLEFDVKGHLEEVGGDSIIIGDIFYRLTPNTVYHMPFGKVKSSRHFKSGNYVGLIMGKDDEVLSMWYLKKN